MRPRHAGLAALASTALRTAGAFVVSTAFLQSRVANASETAPLAAPTPPGTAQDPTGQLPQQAAPAAEVTPPATTGDVAAPPSTNSAPVPPLPLTGPDPVAVPAAPTDVTLALMLSAFSGDNVSGVGLGADIRYRASFVEVGGWFEAGGFFASRATAAGTLGLVARADSGASLAFDAVGGIHSYDGIGTGLLTNDPGVSGDSGFLGGRMRLSYVFASGTAKAEFGVVISHDQDLTRSSKTTSYRDRSWFWGETTTETSVHQIGQSSTGIGVLLGVVI